MTTGLIILCVLVPSIAAITLVIACPLAMIFSGIRSKDKTNEKDQQNATRISN